MTQCLVKAKTSLNIRSLKYHPGDTFITHERLAIALKSAGMVEIIEVDVPQERNTSMNSNILSYRRKD